MLQITEDASLCKLLAKEWYEPSLGARSILNDEDRDVGSLVLGKVLAIDKPITKDDQEKIITIGAKNMETLSVRRDRGVPRDNLVSGAMNDIGRSGSHAGPVLSRPWLLGVGELGYLFWSFTGQREIVAKLNQRGYLSQYQNLLLIVHPW